MNITGFVVCEFVPTLGNICDMREELGNTEPIMFTGGPATP